MIILLFILQSYAIKRYLILELPLASHRFSYGTILNIQMARPAASDRLFSGQGGKCAVSHGTLPPRGHRGSPPHGSCALRYRITLFLPIIIFKAHHCYQRWKCELWNKLFFFFLFECQLEVWLMKATVITLGHLCWNWIICYHYW